MFNYEFILHFNYEQASDKARERFDKFIEKYNANALGTEDRFLRIGFQSDRKIKQKDLEAELKIKIGNFARNNQR